MRHSLLLATAVLAAACTGDIGDTTIGPETTELARAGIAHAPAASGPRVVRFEFGYGLILTDPDTDMEVTYGFDPVALCDGTAVFDVANIMQVNGPNGRAHALVQGDDLLTMVWPFASEVFDCGLFTTTTPIATGTSDLVATNNDVFGEATSTSRHVNSLGFRAHGKLTLSDGRLTPFSATTHCVWDGSDPSSLKCTEKIHLARR